MGNTNSICSGLFGKTRRAVLALLFGRPDTSFYTKQVLDAVQIGRGAVQRELKNLTDSGVIVRETQGRQVYYRANGRCPIFNEISGIVKKTEAGGQKPLDRSQNALPLAVVGEPKAAYSETVIERGVPKIAVPKRKTAAFCRRHHILRLSLFGSVLRDDFRPDSDVDVLVEFDPDHYPGFFRLFDMEEELSALFGRKVDLRTPGELSRYFRQRVLNEAEELYAAS